MLVRTVKGKPRNFEANLCGSLYSTFKISFQPNAFYKKRLQTLFFIHQLVWSKGTCSLNGFANLQIAASVTVSQYYHQDFSVMFWIELINRISIWVYLIALGQFYIIVYLEILFPEECSPPKKQLTKKQNGGTNSDYEEWKRRILEGANTKTWQKQNNFKRSKEFCPDGPNFIVLLKQNIQLKKSMLILHGLIGW